MSEYYEYEAEELYGLLDGLNKSEAVEVISNFIDAKVEGALDSVEERIEQRSRFWSE